MRKLLICFAVLCAGCGQTTRTLVTVKSVTKDVDHADWSGDLVVYRIECDKAVILKEMRRGEIVIPVGGQCFLVKESNGSYSFEFLENCGK